MVCAPTETGGVYRPRQPQQSAFYQLVERFYPEFQRVYAERYQERYGFWRPIIDTTVEKFLECGDLTNGFARVRPGALSEVPARVVRGVFVSWPLLLPELPRETGLGEGGLGR